MTSSIAVQSFEGTLTHHCRTCGAEFTVGEVRGDIDRILVHLTVRNTGEHGTIHLDLDRSHVFLMSELEAAYWEAEYPRIWAQDRPSEILGRVERIFMLHATPGSSLPVSLEPGQTWQGWFETLRRALPVATHALFFVFGSFAQDGSHGERWSFVSSETKPYFALGRGIDLVPLTGPARAWSRIKGGLHRHANAFFSADIALANLIVFTSVFVADKIVGGPFALLFGIGILASYGFTYLHRRYWLVWKALLSKIRVAK
jgi:hypothetical protein